MRPHEPIKMMISIKGTGRIAWAQASLVNAQAFGWFDHFQPVMKYLADGSPYGTVNNARKAVGGARAGRKIVLGKGSNHHRPGPGNRRQIRVNSTCSNFDLAELMHFTNSDWDWMSSKAGVVRTREEWECLYEAARF